MVAAIAGAAVLLTASMGAQAAQPPNKNQIAYNCSNEICKVGLDGAKRVRLTHSGANNYQPTWSPDAKRIAFESMRDGFCYDFCSQIYTMSANGAHQVNISDSPDRADGYAAWSPDGKQIAYTSSRWEEDSQIYVMNPDGSGKTNLSNHPERFDFDPTWSPDGKNLAFTSYQDRQWAWNIYVMNADGSNQVNLSQSTDEYWLDDRPSWSPDSKHLALDSTSSWSGGSWQGSDIRTINVDGSNRFNLTRDLDPISLSPDWSPDGKKIVFWAVGFNATEDIKLMNADGTGRVNLTKNQVGGLSNEPVWAPDGKSIAFNGFNGPDSDIYVMNSDIYVMNPDGSGRKDLTSTPAESDDDPAWPPPSIPAEPNRK